MATYQHCKECGADLTWQEEIEEGLCLACLEKAKDKGDYTLAEALDKSDVLVAELEKRYPAQYLIETKEK
jgi:hypothetical protein